MPLRKADRRSTNRRLDYLAIECVSPELDGGRFPVKRIVGDTVIVSADIFKEGHDQLGAQVVFMGPGDSTWSVSPLRYEYDADRWFGEFAVDRVGTWMFTVQAWTDTFATWRSALKKKVDAGQDVSLELREGAVLVHAASRSAKSSAVRATLRMTAKALDEREEVSFEQKVRRALDDELHALMAEHARRRDLTQYPRTLAIRVDRARARFAAWYEMFPRSQSHLGGDPRHGTFLDAAARLPRLAELGFDVVYLPPIHPIGRTFRKGKNNSLRPEPDDVGSPWAIGNEHGGHTAIEPALGTLADFERFVATAGRLGMEIALDYALQCSPDHPWVKEHPDWFHIRPDGSIQYAENPPKKYQDIYPLNFWCADRAGLWNACRDIFLFWIARGVRTFRVDNPHTKPFEFWEWVIRDVQRDHSDVIFFSEAFTRPKRMKHLAKLGFTMSYTYFTWKNTSWELRAYLEELTGGPAVEYFRGNLFTNTPDILNEYLVRGGRPAFRVRLLLAATLSPLYGIYSGFELVENVPVHAGSEEYLDSEKYQLRPRDYDAEGNINADVQRLNRIRREHVALQRTANLSFHTSDNATILFYRKAPDILVAVNTDPHHVQHTMVHVPIHDLGIDDEQPYAVHDLLSDARYTWRGERNYVRLDPAVQPGHVFRVETGP
jgi:starch synthase (maltosyl-transferring)